MDIIEQFQAAMQQAGLVFAEPIIADGQLHRCHADGDKRGSKNIWYVLYPDHIPAGAFGCWKRQTQQNWCNRDISKLNPADRKAYDERMQLARKQRQEARAVAHAKAREKSIEILAKCIETNNHPYLTSKGLEAYTAKAFKDCLIVSVHDTAGIVHGLQRIYADCNKFFLGGSNIKGNFHLIGEIKNRAYICEGFATGVSLHQATGATVFVAFSAGNLKAAAKNIRATYPTMELIVAGDNDQWTQNNPGLTKAIEAAQAVNASYLVPDFANFDSTNKPKDFNDLMQLAGIEELRRQLSLRKATDKPRLKALELKEFLALQFPPRELILSPWLPKAGLAMIYSRPGIGKTHLSFNIAYAVATGGRFLRWQAEKPRGVLLIDGEMPATAAQERWATINLMYGHDELPAPLRFITPDLQEGAMPDISTPEGQAAINELITDDIELIIIDNLSCLARTGRENESESWLPIQSWALSLRAKGKTVLFIHHSGKGGSQRGSSKKEDILDTIIALKRPENYNPAKGACFEIHFEKSRGFHGADAEPFEAWLTTNQQGQPYWETRPFEESTYQKVARLLNEGLTQAEIVNELGVDKSNVSRAARKAREQGLIKSIQYEVNHAR